MVVFALFFFALALAAGPAVAQVDLPTLDSAAPINITAQAGNRWQEGAYEVWILRGNCQVQQGLGVARCEEAVLWIDRSGASHASPFAPPTANQPPPPQKVIAYLEGNVELLFDSRPGAPRVVDRTWFGRFFSSATVDVRATMVAGKPDVAPPIYQRGMQRRSPEVNDVGWRSRSSVAAVQPAQYATSPPPVAPAAPPPAEAPLVPVPSNPAELPAFRPGMPGPALPPAPGMGGPSTATVGGRRIRVFTRSDVPVQAQWFPDPASNQWIAVIDSGVNVIVDGLLEGGPIDVSTDRLVIWTTGTQAPDLQGGTPQDQRVPLELYMEGNIVFRQGERTIYADRMYYDVPNSIGTVLNAEVLTPVRSYAGLLRFHADVVQQTGRDKFFAQNAFMTSSRLGEPSYRLQSGNIYYEDIQQPIVDPLTGQQAIDPVTGQPAIDHQRMATADNNFLFLGPIPVFYWPTFAADLNDPTYYIRRVRIRHDNVYGTQLLTNWSGYELLGIRNKPPGTDFDVQLDYLGERGFGHGGTFTYDVPDLFGIPGRTSGLATYWGIQDQGLDNLGQDRSAVPPEKDYRFRLFWQHRQLLPADLQLSAELGWISDRNFLEEYFKGEWEELKDQSTGLELKRYIENRSWSITADYRLNEFFTQTNWLPRFDHFWIGQSLFNDTFTWHEHSSLAYGQFRHTDVPENVTMFPSPPNPVGAAGPFNYLPWEQYEVQGGRFSTRQEIDWPFQLGAVKVVPYLLGEASHWGADQAGNPVDRLFGQAGIRASLPMWSVDSTACSDLFNVHGLAHKVTFNAEFFAADANQDMTDLPLYDLIDDQSVLAFRRRFMTTTFGVPSMITVPPGAPPAPDLIPPQFDERFYALRSGLQRSVTSPSTEIADDMMAVRLGVNQRWQTKRGPPDNRHIIDWITFDTNVMLYPDPGRDNFGQTVGLLDYDFRWHVGDRLTLVSDALFDFFNQGQKLVTVGGFLNRPPRGSLYMGFRILEGPINSQVLSLSYSYWMSPKWVSSFGTTVDLGSQGNIGQNLTITRIGESFLISAGFNVDATRNSVGAALAIEPRFLPKSRLGNVGGAQIPPAGAFGLE